MSLRHASAGIFDFLDSISVSGTSYSDNGVTVSHIHTFKHPCHLFSLNWSPDGRYLTAGGVGCVKERVWDYENKSIIMSTDKEDNGGFGIGFTPDSRYVISSSSLRATRENKLANTVWEVQSGKPIKHLKGFHELPQANNSKSIVPDSKGKYVFLDGGGIPAVKVLDAKTFEYVRGLQIEGKYSSPLNIKVHPQGRFLAVDTRMSKETARATGGFGAVQVWNYETGELIKQFPAQTGGVNNLAYSPDGRYLATGGENGHSTRLVSGEPLVTLHDDDLVRVWDTTTFNLAWSYILDGAHVIEGMSYSPDGRFLIATTWRYVYVLDAKSNKVLLSFQTPQDKTKLLFHPRENIFAVSGDELITIWKIEDSGTAPTY